MFLRERLEGICIFLPLQSRISLKHSRNLEEFQCVKDKGASLSWTPVTSDPSDGAASRTVIHQQLVEAHGQGISVGNLCPALQFRVPFTDFTVQKRFIPKHHKVGKDSFMERVQSRNDFLKPNK